MKPLRFIFILIIFAGCQPQSDSEDESILARMDDKYLYESELKDILPKDISARDSLILVKNYINNWITKQVLIKKAERNLTREQKDFSRQIKEYRNSLLVYEYEKKLLQQQLDTVVDESLISRYYDENRQNFILKQNIYAYNFLQIPVEDDPEGILEKLFNQSNPNAKDSIISLMVNMSGLYDLSEDNWLSFNELKRIFPQTLSGINADNLVGQSFKNNNDSFITLLSITKEAKKGDVSPLFYVQEDIREIIIGKRRAEFIRHMHNELVNQAYQKKEAEIY